MADDTYYITPHEAALAVVATSMKKARLRLDTLIINSIIGGILFSAGGMLHLCAQAENPKLWEENPGIIHFQQGAVYAIGLFYVIMMGAELFNSNILYFSVGVCRGAVTIIDLLISWSVSWIFNLGSNLFVCYVICNLSGATQAKLYVQGSIQIVEDKMSYSFIQTFLKGVAGNFCVCLAVYLQLLAKPIHVKLIVMAIPIFTFVSMGFTHTVADMYLVPMGLINGAPYGVGHWIWKGLIPATLGNAVGGSFFGIVIPWYLHLVTVERDRKMLSLPEYDAKDEQPELEMDSRVVRVKSKSSQNPSPEKSVSEDETDGSDSTSRTGPDFNPVSYRPQVDEPVDPLTRTQSAMSRFSSATTRSSRHMRSPPGVFPVMGMGKPLSREATIAGSNHDDESVIDDARSLDSYHTSSRSVNDGASMLSRRSLKKSQQEEEDHYVSAGGYNARENTLGETLKRAVTNCRRSSKESHTQPDIEMGQGPSLSPPQLARRESVGSKLLRTFSAMTQRQPDTAEGINDHLNRHKITQRAASASDNIAGIESYSSDDIISRPRPARTASQKSTSSHYTSDARTQRSQGLTQQVQLDPITSGSGSRVGSLDAMSDAIMGDVDEKEQ